MGSCPVCAHTCTHACAPVCLHVCVCVCVHMCMCLWDQAYVGMHGTSMCCVCVPVCACACVLCACVPVHVVCVCVCVCVYACVVNTCVCMPVSMCAFCSVEHSRTPPQPPPKKKTKNPKEAVYIIIDVSILLQACAAFLYLPSLYSLPTALTLLVGACSCFSRSSSPISFSTLKQKSTFCIVLVLGKSPQKTKHSPQRHANNAVV